MNIVVIGGGKVGATLIEQLTDEDHDITVIDANSKVLTDLTNRYDIAGVCGNGAAYPSQKQASVEKADLVIATTPTDELNILCCMVANQLGAKHTIARIRNPEYAPQMEYLQERMGLSMYINPELETANEITRILHFPSAIKVNAFMRDRAEMIEMKLESGNPLIGLALKDLRGYYKGDILICAVYRGDKEFIPGGNFVLEEHDHIILLGSPNDLNELSKKVNPSFRKVKNVMIVGGSRIAHYLSDILLEQGVRVKIVDLSEKRCLELSEQITGARIICGDARDRELLQEEGIEKMDAFIALTGLDEENIIASIYADSCGVPKVISKIGDRDMAGMVDRLGLDIVVSPKTLTADIIIRYARSLEYAGDDSMKTLYTICNGKIEVMEYHVDGDLPFLGQPLANLKIKPGILIACIVRDGRTIIANGASTIAHGDNVIVVSRKGKVKSLLDIR